MQLAFVQLTYELGGAGAVGRTNESTLVKVDTSFQFDDLHSKEFQLGLVAEGQEFGSWGNYWYHAPSLFSYDEANKKYRWSSPRPVALPFEYRLVVFSEREQRIVAVDATRTEPSLLEDRNIENRCTEDLEVEEYSPLLRQKTTTNGTHVDPRSPPIVNERIYHSDVHFWTAADLPGLACSHPSTYIRLGFYPHPANQRFHKVEASQGMESEAEEFLDLVSLRASPVRGAHFQQHDLGSWSSIRIDGGAQQSIVSAKQPPIVSALTRQKPSNLPENKDSSCVVERATASMHYWTATIDLGAMEGQRLVLKADTVIEEGGPEGGVGEKRQHCHSISLLPRTFTGDKSGRLVLPVMRQRCGAVDDEENEEECVGELDVTFVLVSSFHQGAEVAPLRIIRSLQTKSQLMCGSFVGHRGLGTTHHQSSEAAARFSSSMKRAKLTENTIESLTAAYKRGCDYVEFDVMLTGDNIPVVYHDLVVQVHARDKKKKERREVFRASTLDLVELGATPDISPGGTHRRSGHNSQERDHLNNQLGASAPGSSLPSELLSVGVHQLSRRQLEGMQVAPVNTMKQMMKLKYLIVKHWTRLMHLATVQRPSFQRDHRRVKQRVQYHQAATGHSPYNVVCTETPVFGASAECNIPPYSPTPSATSSEGGAAAASGGGLILPRPAYHKNGGHQNKKKYSPVLQYNMQTRIPSFADLLNLLPIDLGLMIEIKFPFQPENDAMLHEQTSHFEVNRFVDAVLAVLYRTGNDRKKVAFCSFEPNICIALNLKQCRYPVIFLCDSEDDDQKDYRCFSLDTGLQFARAEQLSGVSIPSASLLVPSERPLPLEHLARQKDQQDNRTVPPSSSSLPPRAPPPPQMNCDNLERFETWGAKSSAVSAEKPIVPSNGGDKSNSTSSGGSAATYNLQYAHEVLGLANDANIALWTWGGHNSDHQWCNIQRDHLGVGGIITDNVTDVRGGACRPVVAEEWSAPLPPTSTMGGELLTGVLDQNNTHQQQQQQPLVSLTGGGGPYEGSSYIINGYGMDGSPTRLLAPNATPSYSFSGSSAPIPLKSGVSQGESATDGGLDEYAS